jgi:transcriptional regulator with XRE-family HTH domain
MSTLGRDTEAERKTRLRQFLLDRRRRRCCPGLRREEVADLAGVSRTWYTLFEMARRTSSMRMVDRVADALLLDDEDHSLLLRLAISEVARAWEVYIDVTIRRIAVIFGAGGPSRIYSPEELRLLAS